MRKKKKKGGGDSQFNRFQTKSQFNKVEKRTAVRGGGGAGGAAFFCTQAVN